MVPAAWFDALDARIGDILDVDYETVVQGAQRVLVLWDAHGFEIAEVVLGRILPLIAGRPHLVLMHDISDNRYAGVSRSYEGQPLWKGSTWDKGTGRSTNRVNIGWMSSLQDQVIAVADFATRNDIEIGSADHEYALFLREHAGDGDELRRVLGDRFFSPLAHWAFFSLTGRQPPFHFPAVQHRFRHRADVDLRDIHPKRWFGAARPLPRVIRTSAVPWAYASVIAGCRARREPPAGVQRSLRLLRPGGRVGGRDRIVERGPFGLPSVQATASRNRPADGVAADRRSRDGGAARGAHMGRTQARPGTNRRDRAGLVDH